MNDSDFTEEELAILEDAHLRESQLRNLNVVLNQPMPRAKEKKMEEALPRYITRNFNAQQKAGKVMKKHGYRPKV
jgi:hypothetical protein